MSSNVSSTQKTSEYASSFVENGGRIARLPPEERRQLARKGGYAKADKLQRNREWQAARNAQKPRKEPTKAITGNSPEALLEEILRVYQKLEATASTKPTFYNHLQLAYFLTNIYRLKFGSMNNDKKASRQLPCFSDEIKQIMNRLREEGRGS